MKDRIVIKYEKNREISEYNTDNGLGDKYFEALGSMIFCYTEEGIQYCIRSIVEDIPSHVSDEEKENYIQFIKEQNYQHWIADIMEGSEFLDIVKCGGFIDYDGTLSEVYVDGYISNLGLFHEDICQGGFLVDGEIFKEICENHHVLVNWANK